MLLKNIQRLCKERGTSVPRLEKVLGFGNGAIYQWDKHSPSIDKVQLVAAYFKISIDSLCNECEEAVDETTAKDSTVRHDANAIAFKPRELSMKVILELGEVIERNKLSYEEGARYLKQAAQDVELAAMRASFKMSQSESIPRSS